MSINPACVAEIAAAVGRPIKKSDLDRIQSELTANMRELARTDPEAFAGMSRNQRMVEAGKMAVAKATAQAAETARRKAMTLTAQVRETARFNERAAVHKGRGRENPGHATAFERLRQIENHAKGIRREFMSNIMDALLAMEPKLFGFFHDPVQSREFANAVMNNGKHADPIIAKAAEKYLAGAESMRLRANDAGAGIGKLDYGYLPQMHHVAKVARAGAEAWAAKVLTKLDRGRYVDEAGQPMTDDAVMDLLRGAWETIATGGINKSEPGQFRGTGGGASRFDDAHRVIHFKDGNAYSDYMAEFGEGNMYDGIIGHIGMMSKTIGMMEELGPNYSASWRLLKGMAEKMDGAAGKREMGVGLEAVWDTLNGTASAPVSAKMARVGQQIRSWMVAFKLQGTPLSAITDVPQMIFVAKSAGLTWGRTLSTIVSGIGGASKQRNAQRIGLGIDAVIGEMGRFYEDNMASGLANNIANATMRVSGLNAWTNAMRLGLEVELAGHLWDTKGAAWAELNPRVRNLMEATGVTEADWRIWQQAIDVTGDGMLTKEGIRAIPDDALDAALGGEISATRQELQSQIDELASRNAQESEWLQGRQAKYADALAAAQKEIEAFETGRIRKGVAEIDDLRDRAEMLRAQIEVAESQRVLELDAREGRAGSTVRRAMETGYSAGAAAGERIGNLRRRITELDARIRSRTNAVDADVDAKAETVGRRMGRMARELQEWSERSAERIRRRDAVMQRMGSEIEPRLAQARERAKNRAVARLLGYIDSEANTGVLNPDVHTRATVTQGLRAGTIAGETIRFGMQFKSFGVGIVQKNLRRLQSMPTSAGRFGYSIAGMTALTMFGALSIWLRDLASGRDPRDPAAVKFWTAAFVQGGGMGILGDLFYTGLEGNARNGQANWEGLFGPTFSSTKDFIAMTGGNAMSALDGQDPKFAEDALRFARGHAPFLNLWYARAAIDQAFMHDLNEHLAPGYLKRQRDRFRKDFGQEFWWQPGGQFAPERAPDVGSNGE